MWRLLRSFWSVVLKKNTEWVFCSLVSTTLHLILGVRMRMMPCTAPCECVCVHSACGWAMWSRYRTTVESNMKVSIIYTWLVKTPQHAFFFSIFSYSLLALLASFVHWLRCFLFLNVANRRWRSALNSAKQVCCCGGPSPKSTEEPKISLDTRQQARSGRVHVAQKFFWSEVTALLIIRSKIEVPTTIPSLDSLQYERLNVCVA